MTNAGGLTDREAAIDAIIRFVCSIDEGDPELSASSVTDDSVMDLSGLKKVGMDVGEVHGKAAISETLMSSVGMHMDTSHLANNIRCTMNGDTAKLTCSVLADHWRKGEGLSPQFSNHYVFLNKYDADIVRDGETWKIARLSIDPFLTYGNPVVMEVRTNVGQAV